MPLSTGSITGTYQVTGGTPASGTVEIIPSVPVVKDTAGNVVLSGRLKVTLDTDGHFTASLPSSQAATDPTGITYTVVAKLRHAHLPAVTGVWLDDAETVDMADVTPVDPAAPVYAAQVTQADLDAVTTRVTTLETHPAGDPAGTAQTLVTGLDAELAPVAKSGNAADLTGTDTTMAAKVTDPASATRGALNAAYAGRVEPASYTYNADGTVATETVGGLTTTYAYNADGTIHTMARDGVTRTVSYNTDGTVSGVA